MKQNRNHPIMFQLMLLRNKMGQGTKLEEGYISCPDWVCLAIHLCPGMTIKELDVLGKEWRNVQLSPIVGSADRCHAVNYEATETWGRAPNKNKETPLYFYNDPKRQKGRAREYFLTKPGEKRAKELMKVILQANTDYVRPPGEHSKIYLSGQVMYTDQSCQLMSHFKTESWGLEVDDVRFGPTKGYPQPRHGAVIQKLKEGVPVTIISCIQGDVLFVRTQEGKEGFINTQTTRPSAIKEEKD
jgi:hypothetical protein